MTIPDVHSYEQIVARARSRTAGRGKVRAVLITSSSPDSLIALARAAAEGLVEPVVVGDRSMVNGTIKDNGIGLDVAGMIDIAEPESAAHTAVKMAEKGEVDLIVADESSTERGLHVFLDESGGFAAEGKTVSHVAVLKPEKYGKLMFLSDSLVTPQPDLKAKVGLIQNIVRVAGLVGVNQPRIALLAAVEVVYPQMPVTMEAAVISKMAERGQIRGAYVDGPLSFDVAMDMFAAHEKGITASQVAGQADGFLAPNIEVAGGVYTAMTLYGHCEAGGVVVGGRVPIASATYTDTVQNRFNSIVLGVLGA